MPDVYQIVTDRVMAALEMEEVPWQRPWCIVNGGAYNRVSGKHYSLINQMLLSHSGEYATFKQWTELGGKVRKGEKGEMVVFFKWPDQKEDSQTEDNKEETQEDRSRRPVLRYYKVFHISQVDGVEPLERQIPVYSSDPIAIGEEVFWNYIRREGIRVELEPSNEAYYSPSRDLIHLPELRQYKDPAAFYSTAFHEAAHSTGIEARLARAGLKKASFGSEIYSKEELTAEISACVLTNTLQIETDHSVQNSTAYIRGWLKALQNDRRLIVQAAGQAEKAVNYILNR